MGRSPTSSSWVPSSATRCVVPSSGSAERSPTLDPQAAAWSSTISAEWTRVEGASDPTAWATAAAAWERARPTVSGRLRPVPGGGGPPGGAPDRARASAALSEAVAIAGSLGAGPLREEAEGLARHARIAIDEPLPPDAGTIGRADVGARLGLTARELEVLTLVAAGRTNHEIADALFIAPKTASVHVSNILGKMGVSGRVEAALVAHRLGLV